jgi:D-alanyl-D-alanine carboxypeptidase
MWIDQFSTGQTRRTGVGYAAVRRIVACAVPLFVLSMGTQASAASRHALMAIDANTGETLMAQAADEPRFPASLTKMMTIYMAFEQIELGRLTPSTKLKVSQEAASAAPTKLDLDPGEQIAVIDAVKALITKSANDMAIVLPN